MDELRKLAEYDEDGNDAVKADENKPEEPKQEPPFNAEGSMECRILLKEKDMRHFMFRHTYTSFSGWFGVLLSLIALVMLIIGWKQYDIIHIVALGILALLFTVVQPIQIVLRAKRQIKQQDMFHDTLIYNLCEEGILVRQGEQYVNVEWSGIRKITNTRKAMFIYTSPVRAFILPYDQIDDSGEFKRIISEKTTLA